jgi:hypothetical protein
MTPIDEQVDPGIAAVVNVLRQAGFDTFSSCEGGEGHSFKHPSVRVQGEPKDFMWLRQGMARCLIKAGYQGFYIKEVYGYQKELWKPHCFLEVEFWGDKDQIRSKRKKK